MAEVTVHFRDDGSDEGLSATPEGAHGNTTDEGMTDLAPGSEERRKSEEEDSGKDEEEQYGR